MTHILEIEVPCVPVSQNVREKKHWGRLKDIADAWRVAVLSVTSFHSDAARALDANVWAATPRKVRVSITCYFCPMQKKNKFLASKRGKRLDHANLIGGLKPAFDSLVHAGLIKDDGPKYIEHGEIQQVIERDPKKHRTVIRLELLEG